MLFGEPEISLFFRLVGVAGDIPATGYTVGCRFNKNSHDRHSNCGGKNKMGIDNNHLESR